MMYKGRDLALYIDGHAVAYAQSCDISITVDVTEVATPFAGKAKRFLPGRYSWQINAGAILADDAMEQLGMASSLREGMTVIARLTLPNLATLTGNCYVQSWSASGSMGAMATYKVALIGTGELSVG